MYTRYVQVLFAYYSEVRQENARQERTLKTETLIYAREYAYLCTHPHMLYIYRVYGIYLTEKTKLRPILIRVSK